MMRTVSMTWLIVSLAGCAAASPTPSRWEYVRHSDLCIEGVDLVALLDRCDTRDDSAMDQLFSVSQTSLDGAAAEHYASVVGGLLRDQGDHYFGERLSRQCPQVRETIRDYLLFDFGVEPNLMAYWYPVTFKPETTHLSKK